MSRQYVIVGSGIAGLTAAETLRQRDPHAAITMVSEEPHNFYSRPGLAYLLRGDVPEKQLVVRTPDDLGKLKLKRINVRVDKLECERRELVLMDVQRVPYDRRLVANGAMAVP